MGKRANAGQILCKSSSCVSADDDGRCCVAKGNCLTLPCPLGYLHLLTAKDTMCDDAACLATPVSKCCGQPNACNTMDCPTNYMPRPTSQDQLCKDWQCNKESESDRDTCCDHVRMCSSHECSSDVKVLKLNNQALFCANDACDDAQCCDDAGTCDQLRCPAGYQKMAGASEIHCADKDCDATPWKDCCIDVLCSSQASSGSLSLGRVEGYDPAFLLHRVTAFLDIILPTEDAVIRTTRATELENLRKKLDKFKTQVRTSVPETTAVAMKTLETYLDEDQQAYADEFSEVKELLETWKSHYEATVRTAEATAKTASTTAETCSGGLKPLVHAAKDTEEERQPKLAKWVASEGKWKTLQGAFNELPPVGIYSNLHCDFKHSKSCENTLVLYRQIILDYLAHIKASVTRRIHSRDDALTESNAFKQQCTDLARTEQTEGDLAVGKVTECATLGTAAETAMCNLEEPLNTTCDYEASYQAKTAQAPQTISPSRAVEHQIKNIGRCASKLYFECDDNLDVVTLQTCVNDVALSPAAIAWPVNTMQEWAVPFPKYSCTAAPREVELGRACKAGTTVSTITASPITWDSSTDYDTVLASINCVDQDFKFSTTCVRLMPVVEEPAAEPVVEAD